jgi:hypothetical protein
MEIDQRCGAVCGASRTHGAKRVATRSRLCVCCASICEDTTQCSATGTLPGHAIVVTRWCEVPGTMEPSSQDERQNREEMVCLRASTWGGTRVDGMENAGEPLINVVRTNKPKALIGLSQKACGGHRSFPFLLSQTLAPPADRRLLTHPMAQKRNVVSPALSLQGQQAVRCAYGASGRGGWKKQRPRGNGVDRG